MIFYLYYDMKTIFTLLLLCLFWLPAAAQIDLSGGCFDSPITLTADGMLDGKPAYTGFGSILGEDGPVEIFWDAVDMVWIVGSEGAVFFTLADDTATPPFTTGGTMWTNEGICPSEVTVEDGSPLPVTWLHFKGEPIPKRGVRLHWEVAEESSAGFEVERSVDGTNWLWVGFLPSVVGTGNAAYGFDDLSAVPGNNFYRLRQIDLDGSHRLSEVIRVDFTGNSTELTAYPNPTDGELLLAGTPEPGSLTILNAAGQVIQQISAYVPGSILSLNDLAPGLYLFQFQRGGSESILRVAVK